MSVAENQNLEQHEDLKQYCVDTAERAQAASAKLGLLTTEEKNRWLMLSAEKIRASHSAILEANSRDIEAAPDFGLTDAQVDRLRLTPERIDAVAEGMAQIANLPDPVGDVIETWQRPNGLQLTKTRTPLGVVFFIYESRPNVTADAAAICVKSGNAVILRGGKEAAHSSRAIVDCLQSAAAECGVPEAAVQLVKVRDRAAVGHFLKLPEQINVAIPRGGEGLIRRVAAEAQMPVIKHFDGNCHVYVDASADPTMAVNVTVNSKCQRLGVCNACESLLIHRDAAPSLLPVLAEALRDNAIEIRGCSETCEIVPNTIAATEEDYGTEYLAPIISVRVVADVEEAIEHINRFGSHHTDAIIATDPDVTRRFTAAVDSSAVMVNASTRFNDGGEFGFGAEIGISTDKFHARGPCGLRELTSYKYVVIGDGQIRE